MKVLCVVNAIHRWERLGILTLSAILKRAEHSAPQIPDSPSAAEDFRSWILWATI
jgi:hypothetical protein